MRPTRILLLLTMAAATACENDGNDVDSAGFAVAPVDSPDTLTVTLVAAEVIGGSSATGDGYGKLVFDRAAGLVTGAVTLAGIEAGQVSLRRGYAGEDGPLLVPFDRISSTEWSLPPTPALRADDLAALDTGGLYVSVVNPDSSMETLRGQVIRRSVDIRFWTLFGSQVVPRVDTAATATAALTWSIGAGSEENVIVLHVNVSGLGDVASVHIHEAYAGRNGPAVADLIEDPGNPNHWFTRKSLFDDSALGAFARGYCRDGSCKPSIYLDLHTVRNPAGELRAQLGAPNRLRFLTLTGGDAVPANQSTHVGTVATTLTDIVGWNWTPEIAVYANLPGLDDATAVTLNFAPVGQNGPAVFSLERISGRSDRWFTSAVLNEPEPIAGYGWYLNVETPDYPDGELRAQWETGFNQEFESVVSPSQGLTVLAVGPADGSTIASWPDVITVEFNERLLPTSASLDNIELLASGGDGRFADGNELFITPIAVTADGPTLIIELDPSIQRDDVYRLSVRDIEDGSAEGLQNAFIATFAVDRAHPAPRFAELQQQIFTPGCAHSGCHSPPRPAFGLDLSAGVAYANIVEVSSNQRPDLRIVEPGDPDRSYLIGKLIDPSWAPHPVGQARLSNASMQRLRQWISEGANGD